MKVDENALKLGRRSFYKETFRNEVFLTDVVGILDGPLRLNNVSRAVLALRGGWTTNLPIEDFLAEDALVAIAHDGEPLSLEHGGPARLIVPRLYAWKSAKWVAGVEFLEHDQAGFWEENGYHMRGDPWTQERFR